MTVQIPDAAWRFYGYSPSFALAIVAAVLFFIAFLGHFYIMLTKRAYYMIPFVLGVLAESAGYAVRRYSASRPIGRAVGLLPYIIQSLFIILAPALLAANFYMTFSRVIVYVSEKFSPVRAKRVTIIFVTFDVISFVVQGAGGSLYSSSNQDLYSIAKAILLVGFSIQIISLGIFFLFAILYQIRAKRAGIAAGRWAKVLYTLYSGCALVLARGIFRMIEFGVGTGGQTGYLLTHEAWYYGLECLPILLVSYIFLAFHPARFLPEISDRSARLHPTISTSPIVSIDSEEKADIGSSQEKLENKKGWFRKNKT